MGSRYSTSTPFVLVRTRTKNHACTGEVSWCKRETNTQKGLERKSKGWRGAHGGRPVLFRAAVLLRCVCLLDGVGDSEVVGGGGLEGVGADEVGAPARGGVVVDETLRVQSGLELEVDVKIRRHAHLRTRTIIIT